MRKLIHAALLLALIAAASFAQAGDPPSRVARLNYMSGTVSFRPASVDEWAAASLNYPLTMGDHLWTDSGARTELHIGSTALRMDGETAFAILNLDDRMVQLSVTGGVLNVHIRNLSPEESYEIDTPNVALSLLRPGDYRIEVPARGEEDPSVTVVTARGGEVEVTGGGAAFTVHPGQSARVMGTDSVTQEVAAAMPPDGFQRWCDTREHREDSAVSAAYVPRDMIGYEDLDEYGRWRRVEPYGWVWAPNRVEVEWAPYRFGHWAWVDPWGWTWIDDAPWGFAPFHYGRWAFVEGGWFWVPGRMVVGVRPVYAPALVAFVGGPRFSVAVGIGGGAGMAAWFPLGPGEVYRPAYHVSEAYVRQVNIVHVTNVTVINNVNVTNVRYVNQTMPGAVTAVSHETFVSARPVRTAVVRVDPREVAQAQVIGTTAPVPPRRESIVAGPVRHDVPVMRTERQVVVKSTPPPPPVSFSAKQEALRANQGRPLDSATENNLRGNAPARNPMVRTAPAAPRNIPPPRNDRPANSPTMIRPDRQVQNPPGNNPPPVRTDRQVQSPPANNPPVRTDVPARTDQNPPPPRRDQQPARTEQTPPAVRKEPAQVRTERQVEAPPPRNEPRPAEERKGPPQKGERKKGTGQRQL